MEKLQFKGKEFKGSEGEFGVYEELKLMIIHDSDLLDLQDIDSVGVKAEANARLFANSKNLLRAAIEAYNELKFSLINQAMMVSEDYTKIESHPTLKKLETEILKSL